MTIYHGVTIGEREKKQERNHEVAQIEDGVVIGTGAVILGGVVIGPNARIGANAVVLSDVPAEATAVGIPAKVLAPRPID